MLLVSRSPAGVTSPTILVPLTHHRDCNDSPAAGLSVARDGPTVM